MLGPLEAWRSGQRLVLGGQRQRSVLACLMLDPGHDVSADRIIDAIWGDRPPSGVSTTLQTYVFHLREVLEPARGKGDPARVVVTVPGGYRLDTAHAALDADRFEELVGAGRAALGEDPQRAAALLVEALAMWRGDVLSDLASLNGLVASASSRLAELRVSATEAWVEAELALGHHDAVLPVLDGLVEQHPLREHLAALQMLVLYRAGRQSDALQAYRRLRRTLKEELGIQPSSEVETMQQRVLRQDPSLLATPAPEPVRAIASDVPPEPPAAGSTQLPLSPSQGGERRDGLSRRSVAAIIAVVLVAAFALTATILLLRRGDVRPLPGNSVGPVDAAGLHGDAVALKSAPSALVSAGGAVWAALESDDAIAKIDPKSRTVLMTVPQVGGSPQAVATSGDDLWVAGFEEGVLVRINMPDGVVVGRIHVGIQPSAVVASPDGVWVANAGDNTVQRVDPRTQKPDPPIQVGEGPDALALDGSTLWVANGRAGTLTRIDTATRAQAQADVEVDPGPASLAVTATDVWVANELSATVSRVSKSTGKVQPIAVADGPSSLLVHGGQVWVTDRFSGSVSEIDTDTNAVQERALGSAPVAVAVVDDEVWVAAGAYANGEHRGGTLAWTGPGFDDMETLDPAGSTIPMYVNLIHLAYDGLVAQRPTGGLRSLVVVADLATDVPKPSDGGRTYVFNIRKGVRYSTGEVVKPSDFLRGFQRALRPDSGGTEWLKHIVGAASCTTSPRWTQREHCNLTGVVPDDANGRLTVRLSEPDPELLDKLTNLVYPRPAGIPTDSTPDTPVPGTGPYQVAKVDHGSVTLSRNPYFQQWSAAAQPDGYPDVISYRPYVSESAGMADVLDGRAQGIYAQEELPPAVTSRPAQVHFYDELQVQYLFPNTTQPPFNDERVRQALSYALDRRRIAQVAKAKPACQMVPPTFPGYVPYCPHQSGPATGPYQGPDLAKAKQLVAESGTTGMPVTVQHRPYRLMGDIARYTASVLSELGYQVDVKQVPDDVGDAPDPYFDTVQLMVPLGWLADYPSPGTFYNFVSTCGEEKKFNRYCNRDIEAAAAKARALAGGDPSGSLATWAMVDQMLVNTAAIIPTDAQIGTIVTSTDVHNVLIRPINGPILNQMWVQ
jgi:ABC-type transport system substrate-binding protein/DNA-binding SARP family transcriptional activator